MASSSTAENRIGVLWVWKGEVVQFGGIDANTMPISLSSSSVETQTYLLDLLSTELMDLQRTDDS